MLEEWMIWLIVETIVFIMGCIIFVIYKRKKQRTIQKNYVEKKFDKTQTYLNELDEKFEIGRSADKHYQLLKLVCDANSNVENILGDMGITTQELNHLIKESIDLGFLQVIDDDEVEVTDQGLNYIKSKEH